MVVEEEEVDQQQEQEQPEVEEERKLEHPQGVPMEDPQEASDEEGGQLETNLKDELAELEECNYSNHEEEE